MLKVQVALTGESPASTEAMAPQVEEVDCPCHSVAEARAAKVAAIFIFKSYRRV